MSIMQSRIAEYERMYGQAHPGRRMSEREFDAWRDEKTRAEWVDGEVEMMAPVSVEHDDLVWWLRTVLRLYAQAKGLGSVHGPEVIVRLALIRRKRLPDVMFVSKERASIVKTKKIDGVPDLIIEVVSLESAERDYLDKFEDYQRAGVREYWIVDPIRKECRFHRLSDTKLYKQIIPDNDTYETPLLPLFKFHVPTLWQDELPDVLQVVADVKAMIDSQ